MSCGRTDIFENPDYLLETDFSVSELSAMSNIGYLLVSVILVTGPAWIFACEGTETAYMDLRSCESKL